MKKIILSPVFFICLVWILFSFPYLFQGKVPFPSSYQVNFFSPWNGYSEFASPYKNGATPDVIGQIYPWRFFTIESWRNFEVPLWNPYSFSGTYHLANYQSAVFSPLNIGFFFFPFIDWWSILVLAQPLFAGLFMILYVRTLGLGKYSQIISSLSFMFCGFIVTWMLYATLAYAILFLPLALFSIEKYLKTQKYRYVYLLALCVPLSFFSGHFQTSFYFLLFILYYIFLKVLFIKSKRLTIPLGVGIIFGLCISCIQIIPSISAYSQSFRSEIFQLTEVIPLTYIPTFFAPDFLGNPVTRNDWFGHYAEWNGYIGLVPLFFAIYSLFFIKKREIIIFVVPALFSLLLAFHSPLLDLLLQLKIPVLSTSAASRIIVLYSFSAAILSGFGIAFFMEDVKKRKYLRSILVLMIFLTVFLVLWAIVLLKLFIPSEYIQVSFSNLRLPSLVFFTTSVVVLFSLFFKKKNFLVVSISFLLFLSVFDLYRFVTKWTPFDPKNLAFVKTPVSQFFTKISGEDRVFASFGAEGSVFYKLPSVEGYDAVYKKTYGSFIESIDDGIFKDPQRSVVAFPKDNNEATIAANFLGVKYIVHKISDGQNVWEFPFWKYNPDTIKLLYEDKGFQVLENTNAYPRAFLVDNIIIESDPQKTLDLMFRSGYDLRDVAIIKEKLPQPISGGGTAKIIKYMFNRIEIETKSDKSSFLVLTDTYDSDWRVTVNGIEERNYITDLIFRGVQVPAGENKIVFSYMPKSFYYGLYMAIFGIMGLIIFQIIYSKKWFQR